MAGKYVPPTVDARSRGTSKKCRVMLETMRGRWIGWRPYVGPFHRVLARTVQASRKTGAEPTPSHLVLLQISGRVKKSTRSVSSWSPTACGDAASVGRKRPGLNHYDHLPRSKEGIPPLCVGLQNVHSFACGHE